MLAVDKEVVSLVDHDLFCQSISDVLRIQVIGLAVLNVYLRANEIVWLKQLAHV